MKAIITALIAFFMLLSAPAFAASKPFDQAQFDALTAAGKPVVVQVHAEWCLQCRTQAPILKNLMTQPDYSGYTLFVVDFDKDKAARKTFNVNRQSTIIVFKGKTEVARSLGETDATKIEILVAQAKK